MNLADTARFFIVYPLDLEDLGLIELKEKYEQHFSNSEIPLSIIGLIPGGIEIECPLFIGLSMNKILRTPTRILLRVGEFKCRDAPKLYLKMSKFNWAPWFIGQTPDIASSSTNSRLFDSRKIEKAITDGVLQYYRHKPSKKKYLEHLEKSDKSMLPKIYFRAVDDLCTISIDTTGERLHLRGEKILSGLAPIRESLAALLLIELKKYLKQPPYTLIDPMCGSATLLLEAISDNDVTTKRDFAFYHLPIVLDDKSQMMNLESKSSPIFFNQLFGFDNNAEVVALAKKNTNGSSIVIASSDLFSANNNLLKRETPVVAIINPPYGIRVGEKEEINYQYYLNIIESIRTKYSPELLGIIIPGDYKLKANKDFKILSLRPFKNGGIDVVFYVLGFK